MLIKTRLLSLPREIADVRDGILTQHNSLADLNEQKRKWEVEQSGKIANAVGEDGKSLYSNDVKRQAALAEIKEKNTDYIQLDITIKNVTDTIKKQEIQLERLCNEQSNLRAICRLGSEE